MWDWLANAGSGLGEWFKGGENLKGVRTLIGGAGQAYGVLAQDKAAREMMKSQNELNAEDRKRREKTQLILDNSFSNLTPITPRLPLGV